MKSPRSARASAAGRSGSAPCPGSRGPADGARTAASGRANLCAAGHADRMWGAFAEYVRVPAGVVAANLHRIPEGLDDEVAAFLDPVASVFHGWNRLRAPSGSHARLRRRRARVPVGVRGVAARPRSRRWPAGARSARPWRSGTARGSWTSRGRAPPAADVAVDCTGQSTVWERLAELVRPGGQVLLFGGCAPGARVGFDAARLHYGELSLVGAFHYTPDDARAALDGAGRRRGRSTTAHRGARNVRGSAALSRRPGEGRGRALRDRRPVVNRAKVGGRRAMSASDPARQPRVP